MMTRKKGATAYVGDFIRGVYEKNPLPVTPKSRDDLWISRAGEGVLYLDQSDSAAYTATVDRLGKEFANEGDLSSRTLEQYIQDALFYSLDIQGRLQKPFNERVNDALAELRKRLSSPLLSYRCFVPVHGFTPKDLPFTFGGIRFVKFGASHQRQLMKPIRTEIDSKKFRSDLKEGKLWGNPCAIIKVKARDFDSAQFRARFETRAAVDSINFFHDLIPYNHGWLFLPGEGESTFELSSIVSSEGQVLLAHARVGPIAPFSLENLRKYARFLRHLRALSALSRTFRPKSAGEVLLTAARWAGRASVEPKREQSFLLFAIALEAMILPEGSNQELTYRLSLRVASLLGSGREQRAEVKESVKRLYKVRSAIVHSGSYEVTDEDLGRLRTLTKGALLRLLRRRSLWNATHAKLGEWLESRI
jgi:hypothetical protein